MAAALTTILLSLTIAGLALMAGAGRPPEYASIAGLGGLGIAALATWTQYRLERSAASRSDLAASSARHVSYVWILGGITLLVVYGQILVWREWLTFAVAMLLVGGASFGLSILFRADAAGGRNDAAMLGFARTLGIVQLVGMIIAMIGLLADGKMAVAFAGNRSDWAANSTFFFGAMAIAIISALGLMADRRAASREAAAVRNP